MITVLINSKPRVSTSIQSERGNKILAHVSVDEPRPSPLRGFLSRHLKQLAKWSAEEKLFEEELYTIHRGIYRRQREINIFYYTVQYEYTSILCTYEYYAYVGYCTNLSKLYYI